MISLTNAYAPLLLRCTRLVLVMLCVMAALMVVTSTAAPGARAQTEGIANDAITQIFADLRDNNFITVRVVVAVKSVIKTALMDLMDRVYQMLQPAIAAFMVLVVIFFGMNMATGGVRNPRGDIPILAIKLVLVTAFTADLKGWVDGLFDVTESLMSIVSTGLVGNSFGCMEGEVPAIDNPESYRVWQELDCIFIKFLGFAAIGSAASVMMGMLVSTVVSYLGVYVFVTGVGAFVGFLFSILRVTYMYISSILGLAFLLMLAPLFVPLILLKSTTNYFNKWVNLCVVFILQPVVQLTFVMFMVTVYSVALFSGQNSLANALGLEINPRDFNVSTLAGAIGRGCLFSEQMTANSGMSQEQTAAVNGFGDAMRQLFGGQRGGDSQTDGIAVERLCVQMERIQFENIVPRNLTSASSTWDEKIRSLATMEKILMAFLTLGIITLIMYTMTQVIDSMARDLVGRSFRLNISYQLPFEGALTDTKARNDRSGAIEAMGNTVMAKMDSLPLLTNNTEQVGTAWSEGLRAGVGSFLQNGLPFGGQTAAGLFSQATKTPPPLQRMPASQVSQLSESDREAYYAEFGDYGDTEGTAP